MRAAARVEPCGPEASAFTRDFVPSREVTVLRPSAAPVTDQHGRLLGEVVRTGDGASLNVALASAGPAYRECLPASSGDLDCAEVGHQVTLLGDDDPWRLDGDSTTRCDGVGCESSPPWGAMQAYPYG